MPRKIIETSSVFPYHICARCNNQDWYSIPMPRVYNIYARIGKRTQELYDLRFELFVLMGNHFHALVSTPQANLSLSMRYFMTESSRAIALASGKSNHIYGQRYHWTIIKSPVHYAIAYKYICRNPVAAQITQRVEYYPWTSLWTKHTVMRELINRNTNGFGDHVPEDNADLKSWLNECYEPGIAKAIKVNMNRHTFKDLKDSENRKFYDQQELLPK